MGRQNLQIIIGRVLLLYQMPKAGSQTLEATLRHCGFQHQILRFHFLSQDSAVEIRRCLAADGVQSSWKRAAVDQLKLMPRLSTCLRIRRFLTACGLGIPKLEVITAVREVLGAALSSVFQNHRLFVPDPKLLTVQKCQELLSRRKLVGQFQQWFEAELRPHIGINVFASAFPIQKRYAVYENRFSRVLLYRFDALPSLAPVLSDFLGLTVPSLSTRNLGDAKEYSEAYQQVRTSLKLAPDFVHSQNETQLMRHFYSAEERASFERKWGGDTGCGDNPQKSKKIAREACRADDLVPPAGGHIKTLS